MSDYIHQLEAQNEELKQLLVKEQLDNEWLRRRHEYKPRFLYGVFITFKFPSRIMTERWDLSKESFKSFVKIMRECDEEDFKSVKDNLRKIVPSISYVNSVPQRIVRFEALVTVEFPKPCGNPKLRCFTNNCKTLYLWSKR